ncbi:hypothetical protein C8N35_108103 [Breoghania corrubedonensis]|uniref:Uncharacterized protein n=1 Tax=Breoghania corrubedonensis TaxID=665038 RepID=A0A2T5V5M3_9HYPH|nr:hypothetical protein [Breoghania corrubedonensis]PTW59067.1 hypothetical protein C8N35_108103 [Breoghania corrubedonensis]
MSESKKMEVKERLALLSKAIDEKVKQLDKRGELTSRHEAYAGDLKKRQYELHVKLEKSVHDNNFWEAMKSELELDSSALLSEFRSWVEGLDTGKL